MVWNICILYSIKNKFKGNHSEMNFRSERDTFENFQYTFFSIWRHTSCSKRSWLTENFSPFKYLFSRARDFAAKICVIAKSRKIWKGKTRKEQKRGRFIRTIPEKGNRNNLCVEIRLFKRYEVLRETYKCTCVIQKFEFINKNFTISTNLEISFWNRF